MQKVNMKYAWINKGDNLLSYDVFINIDVKALKEY
jgi:hypothetical protein